MEEELVLGLVTICVMFLALVVGYALYGLFTNSSDNLKIFKKKLSYKKIDNLYEEFVLSHENQFSDLEYNIKLCYFIIIGAFVAIPILVLYLFIFEYTKIFLVFTIIIIIILILILNFIFACQLPSYLNRKNELFKDGLIKYVIKENLTDFNYKSQDGIDAEDYVSSKFYEKFDAYFSEDLMSGKIGTSKIKMAEVETLEKDEENLYPLFHGLFAHVKLKNKVKNSIIITSTNVELKNRELVSTTSDRFNESYHIYTKGKLTSYALLEKRTIDLLCELADLSSIDVDIKIEDNDIFLRFGTGPLFDDLIFSKEEKKRLYEFSLICDIIRSINDSLIKLSR